MARLMMFVLCVLTCARFAVSARADDPPKKLTPAERKELYAKWKELNDEYKTGETETSAEATKLREDALKIARQLYPEAEYPEGHVNLAASMYNLGIRYKAQGKYADAEPLLKGALEMRKRFYKDHARVGESLTALGLLYKAQAKYSDAEPLLKDALEMRKRLFNGDHPDVAAALSTLGQMYKSQGKYIDAERLLKEVLEMDRRLYKGDHQNVGDSLRNLGTLYEAQDRYSEAELLLKETLEMDRRLHKGDHPDVAGSITTLGRLYAAQGKYAAAEPLFKEALEMRKRLHTGDHARVAGSLTTLGQLFNSQKKYAAAEPLLKDALEMYKRLHTGDHPRVAEALNHLGTLYGDQQRYAEAEPLLKGALEMARRLHTGDHHETAQSLNNLAALYRLQGKCAAAEPLLKEVLEMARRLYPGDHPNVAVCLNNLAVVYSLQGKYADAEPLYRGALEMDRRFISRFARENSEGETLTRLASRPLRRDGLLSNELARGADPSTVYPQVWAEKGAIARVYERRHQQARAAATDPRAAKMLAELADARERRAELLLAPATKDPATLKKRNDDIKGYENRISELTRAVKPLLPAVARADRLEATQPGDLQKALPADAAVVDFLYFVRRESTRAAPGEKIPEPTGRYLAFVVTREKIAWVDLDTAANIEPAVESWRAAITGNPLKGIRPSPPETVNQLGTKLRELVWAKVRKELPPNIKALYICPDVTLCELPWAVLPGEKPGTVLLEDFAVATIPHALFLLDQFWPQDPIKTPPASDRPGALVVGGVKYDAEPALPAPGALASRGEPLVKPGAKLVWSALPATVGEANGVAEVAARKKLAATRLDGSSATPAAVLSALSKVRYAHLATHGFFADESFRSVFQLDRKDYQMRGGERIGRAVNSPLVMTGLVFAGANNPKTPGRGIITGEQLIDLDLSGLELAVLSACETGLGALFDAEGSFGLQRAFHYAGTRDVVASLWKVPDQSTAALMSLFYRNLWERSLSPMESLRQAQLEIYRNPQKISELAKGFRGTFEEVPGAGGEIEIKPGNDGKAHPLLWAAFTLSGPGR